MRRLVTTGFLVAGLIAGAGLASKKKLVIQAQTVPATVHAQWNPNAAADAVQFYTVSLDGGTGIQVQASTCTTTCASALSIPTFGNHTVSVTATNFLVSTDPSSAQTSGPATVTFTLAQSPKTVTGLGVGR